MKEGKYKNKYRIRSARRPHWNYADGGFYFVTICTKNREYFFGDISDAEMIYSEIGIIAENELLLTGKLRNNMELDEWIIMPNHVHVIITIDNAVETHCRNVETHCNASLPHEYTNKFGPQRNNLSSIVRGFKSAVKQKCDKSGFNHFAWQPRFYDRVIRNEQELQRIRKYVYFNPDKWDEDQNNTENIFM